jgi:aminomethyltransferase
MCIVDLQGARVRDFLRYLVANDVARLDKKPGKALYSCMLNDKGGVIDDLIIYYMDTVWYRLVVNAGTRDKDLAWIERHASSFDVSVEERNDLGMIAVQGPDARYKVHDVMTDMAVDANKLDRFEAYAADERMIARTGYTGEDGYEIILPTSDIESIWQALIDIDVKPCGLGARDTLRLEAGMNLYGQDMTDKTTPLVSGLAWTVALNPVDRKFIGRPVLEQQINEGIPTQLVGLVLDGKGVLRAHQKVLIEGFGEGEITSGSFSPTLGRAIALARIPARTFTKCEVEVRDRLLSAQIVKPPFVRNGKSTVSTAE